ncbi:MAG: polynucleotide kinase-phosphatase [Desulfobacterales bacterium]|nr:polynucleotide kinase-phosphatase [Desulfobacterales bacterium]
MNIQLPEISLIFLIGASSSGKSQFARKHFKPTEVLSSDYCRALASDNETDQSATADAFDILHFIAAKRLAAGRLTVVDATNVQAEARKSLLAVARKHHCLAVAIVLNIPRNICFERHKNRSDRDFGEHVIRQQAHQLKQSLSKLKKEGFHKVFIMETPEETEQAVIERRPLWNNKKHEHGPFDIIGDIHGCFDELCVLMKKLGYVIEKKTDSSTGKFFHVTHPQARKVIFLGDLVDRGPKIPDVLRLVINMVESGTAFCVPGNHDDKYKRKLSGRKVAVKHGLEQTLDQMEKEPGEFRQKVYDFIYSLVSHHVFDNGNLVVAHAGMKEEFQGRTSGKVRSFALYGDTTGETDKYGLPVRHNWAAEYRGKAVVVYGHTAVPESEWLNRTINIDTGCVFGGKLTALRYPEKEIVSVPAKQVYQEPVKPFLNKDRTELLTAQQQHDDLLDIEDVSGKRIISTRLRPNITIREENTIPALEVMARFAANPKWLIYLPPTMSPCETSDKEEYLEYPEQAFDFYRRQGLSKVVCQEKHMGSRAVVIVCRDTETAKKHFGISDNEAGICYTRTGRRFFNDLHLENELLEKLRQAVEKAGIWDEFETGWVCLDCELMPWSAKAQALIKEQYAAVGCAGTASFQEALQLLEQAGKRSADIAPLLERYSNRAEMMEKYIGAYKKYCWPVNTISDIKLAPFHFLATQGKVHADKTHIWHMKTLEKICKADKELLLATAYKTVEPDDRESVEQGINWWTELTGKGGEGMVVKPFNYVELQKQRLVQPAVKCRGREYLRIIYGPEYTAPEHLERLRARGLSSKRSLSLREFCLGIEGLERFVRREPLRKVHECVFGILALESESVDPRL